LGRQLKFRKSSTLLPRTLSALFLIPLCLYVIYLGPPYSLILGWGVTLGLFIEWIRIWLKCTLFPFSKAIYGLLGTFYLAVATIWFIHQLGLSEAWRLIYWLFFLVWSTDIAAYAGGKLFKGPKLVPSISPNKTWSGFFTGMAGGIAVAYGTSYWFFPGVFTFWQFVVLVLIAQVGDLLESQAKRWGDVKDSSSLIPGHGGLLGHLGNGLLKDWQSHCHPRECEARVGGS
jgi:phosphatidate cytidylyltransferase